MTLLPKLLAPLVVIVTLLAGTWFWGGVVAPGYTSVIVLVVAWFVLCSVLFGRVGKARPQLRWWLRGTFLACSAVSLVAFYTTSLRDTVVNETLPDAVPASELVAPASGEPDPLAPQPEAVAEEQPEPAATPKPATHVVERVGAVQPTSHAASGTARVVKLAPGGRTLTFSDGFEVDPGPEIRVYLATDAGAKTFKDLGRLKGTKGDQQYDIPAGLDLGTYDTVVLYCIPFTVSVAKVDLRPA